MKIISLCYLPYVDVSLPILGLMMMIDSPWHLVEYVECVHVMLVAVPLSVLAVAAPLYWSLGIGAASLVHRYQHPH